MNIQEIINQGYQIIYQNFQNTRMLSFEQFVDILKENLYEQKAYELTQQDQYQINEWFDDFINFKYIEDLVIQDSSITEVFLCLSPYYKTSKESKKKYLTTQIRNNHFQLHLEIMAHNQKQNWNFTQPFASFFYDFPLASGKSRITLVHKSLSPNELSHAFIRIIPEHVYKLDNFQSEQSSQLPEEFYQKLISSKKNILITGATGSGKTSFLSCLLNMVSHDEHLISIEDTKELISPIGSTQLLASKELGKSMEDLCGYVLRMSPDRIVLGEMRSKEIIPFFLMMNTGHRGLLSTIHSNNAIDAIHRCSFLFSLYSQGDYIDYNQALKMVAQNIDYVIYLENKKVVEVIKVLGTEKGDCFYETVSSSQSSLTSDFFVRDSLRN